MVELDEAGRAIRLLRLGADGTRAEETRRLDERGRSVERVGPDGRRERLGWDDADRLRWLEGPAGRRELELDRAGRLAVVRTPAGRLWRLAWGATGVVGDDGPAGPRRLLRDASRSATARRDASGREVRLERDASGRAVRARARRGEEPPGLLFQAERDATGRLVALESDASRLELVHQAGDLLVHDRAAGVELRWQQGGERLATPWGELALERDAAGRPARLRSPAGAFELRPDGVGFPSGLRARRTLDGLGRPVREEVRGPDGALLLELTSAWSARHERVAIARDGAEIRYAYDAAGRLAAAEPEQGPALRWAWDPDGHPARTARGPDETAWEVDARGRLVTAGATRFRHDPAGRLVAIERPSGVDRFGWDAAGRLARCQRAGGPLVSWERDALGRVVRRVVEDERGARETRLVYDGDRLLAELGPGERRRVWVHGPGLDAPLAVGDEAGRWTYLHQDALGSVLLLTDAAGAVTARQAFEPFGRPTCQPADPRLPVVFAGMRWDPEARVYLHRARPYDPELGRFLAPDPAGLDGGLNAYAWAEGSPLDLADPLGLWSVPGWARDAGEGLAGVVEATGLLLGIGHPLMVDTARQACWEDLATGKAQSRALGTMDAYAGFVSMGFVDPHLRARAFDPAEAARGEAWGEAAGWAFTVASGAGALKQAPCLLTAGARALPRLGRAAPALTGDAAGAARAAGVSSRGLRAALEGERGALSATSAEYLEYRAQRLQGADAPEAHRLMKAFRAGENPGGAWGFHFTDARGGVGITREGALRAGNGLAGRGVYAGTTPTPSWFQKHVPLVGWGLPARGVRIPVRAAGASRPLLPTKTLLFPVKEALPLVR